MKNTEIAKHDNNGYGLRQLAPSPYPMAMEIPVLNEYFENISEVRDAPFRDQCTMECEFCDCTRNIKLPGKPLMDELGTLMTSQPYHDNFIDLGRIKLNRKKQKVGVYALKSLCNDNSFNKLKSILADALIVNIENMFNTYIVSLL